jgi:outer membrane immunogenic protein
MRFRLPTVAALAVCGALPVFAADYPVLRGTSSPSLPPPPVIHDEPASFDGFYIGGLAGYNSINFDPGSSGRDQLRNSTLFLNTYYESQGASSNLILPQFSSRGMGFGAFIGYNAQFGEAVVGIEADYMYLNRRGSSSGPVVGRLYENSSTTEQASVTLSGTAAARINDLFTIRGRAGYAMGNIMPYVTAGLALGYGEVSTGTNATVILQQIVQDSPRILGPSGNAVGSPSNIMNRRKNAFMAGFTVGTGVEAVFGGLILRGEYLFSRVHAQGGTVIDVNQGRVGAGVKF